ncbi:MAG: hypothetical protein ACRDP3_15230 [Streptomyces sp.]|uniref:hypothetical protein n=1 Tax=Streptomyces sp. TaxID=1931 RepID=UPI003D6A1124
MDQRAASCGFGSKAEEGGDAERRRPTTTPEAESQGVGSPPAIAHQVVSAGTTTRFPEGVTMSTPTMIIAAIAVIIVAAIALNVSKKKK